jgi:2-phospho-L-lactate guanylyltransferase
LKTFAIVPAKNFENAKTRLSPLLAAEQRISLSALMLEDTLQALARAPVDQVVVVSGDRRAEEIAGRHGAKFLREERESGVNSAVALADGYCAQAGADATIVIPEDLPLLDAADVAMMMDLAASEQKCIVICPSLRYDGTNALLKKPPIAIKTSYDNNSYEAHIMAAQELGIPVKLFFSKKLMVDIDTPEDAMQLAKEAGPGKALEFLKAVTAGSSPRRLSA